MSRPEHVEPRGPEYIAGPCSAESREQVLRAAEGVAEVQGVRLFRAGLWKPRTRPGSFEGVGERGLPWLLEAFDRYGIPPCVEVGLPSHVEAAARAGLQAVWLGARTTGDPFAVGELSAALRGTRLRVLVKNPLTPGLGLWLGALERIEEASLSAPSAVHRGFVLGGATGFRSAPVWHLPVELRRRRPDLQVLCDPSHIAGKRELVYGVAQTALDLGMDGLMVEVHPEPGMALSDAAQQLDVASFTTLCDMLKTLGPLSGASGEQELAELRERLSMADEEILLALSRRWKTVRSLADAKQRHAMAVFQVERATDTLSTWRKRCERMGLPAELGDAVYLAVHEASVYEQTKELGQCMRMTMRTAQNATLGDDGTPIVAERPDDLATSHTESRKEGSVPATEHGKAR